MAPSDTTLTAKIAFASPYQLDRRQTVRAAGALSKHIRSSRRSAEADAPRTSLLAAESREAFASGEVATEDDDPIWLIVTTKKHIADKKRLKPGKIALPHSLYTDSGLRICLITADPQRAYKDIVADPSFPTYLAPRISRVIGISKLKTKWKSYESRRALLAEHDIFMADDRVVTYLPQLLGKVFYKTGLKRPIPVSLMGYERRTSEAQKQTDKIDKSSIARGTCAQIAHEIERTLKCALVNVSPSATMAIKVAKAGWSCEQVSDNVESVVDGLVARYIPKGWRNVRSIHIKGPNTTALPIWLADELWADEEDVLDEKFVPPERKHGMEHKDDGRRQQLLEASGFKEERSKRAAEGGLMDEKLSKKGRMRDVNGLGQEAALRRDRLTKQKAKAIFEAE